MTEFTPGPWAIGNGHDCAKDHAICAGPQIVARVVFDETKTTRSHHTARLIAAAPDLLDVCVNGVSDVQQVLDSWAQGDLAGAVNGLEAWQESARAAITKARGTEG